MPCGAKKSPRNSGRGHGRSLIRSKLRCVGGRSIAKPRKPRQFSVRRQNRSVFCEARDLEGSGKRVAISIRSSLQWKFFSKHPVHRPQRKNSTIVMAVFFNCGFARAAVKSYTTDLSGKKHTLTDERRAERLDLFKSQFSFTTDKISANPHLETFGKATECQHTFDRNCSNLMKVFSRTWPGRAKQQDAFKPQFKPEPWRKLPRLQHLSHNVRHCYACAHKFPALHTAFPVRATTTPKNTVSPLAFKLAEKIHNTKDANQRAAAHNYSQVNFQGDHKEDERVEGNIWARHYRTMAKPELWWITAHTNQSRTSEGKKGNREEGKERNTSRSGWYWFWKTLRQCMLESELCQTPP